MAGGSGSHNPFPQTLQSAVESFISHNLGTGHSRLESSRNNRRLRAPALRNWHWRWWNRAVLRGFNFPKPIGPALGEQPSFNCRCPRPPQKNHPGQPIHPEKSKRLAQTVASAAG